MVFATWGLSVPRCRMGCIDEPLTACSGQCGEGKGGVCQVWTRKDSRVKQCQVRGRAHCRRSSTFLLNSHNVQLFRLHTLSPTSSLAASPCCDLLFAHLVQAHKAHGTRCRLAVAQAGLAGQQGEGGTRGAALNQQACMRLDWGGGSGRRGISGMPAY